MATRLRAARGSSPRTGECPSRTPGDGSACGRFESFRIRIARGRGSRRRSHIVTCVSAGIAPRRSRRPDGHAVAELVRALEAQDLFDGALDQPGSAEQPLLLIRILRQRDQAVADQIGRRLVAGVEHEDAVVQQLGVNRSPASSPWISRVSTSRSGSPGLARRRAISPSR